MQPAHPVPRFPTYWPTLTPPMSLREAPGMASSKGQDALNTDLNAQPPLLPMPVRKEPKAFWEVCLRPLSSAKVAAVHLPKEAESILAGCPGGQRSGMEEKGELGS